MHFSISICVFSAYENYFGCRDREGTTSPQWVSHADSMYEPVVFLNLIHLDSVVNFLLSTSKESSKGVNELVVDAAGRQVVALVLHGRDLDPLVFLDYVLLNGVQALFA